MESHVGPERVFVVRHGERVDKVDLDWGRGAARPHDPPLTPKGESMARALGQYLRAARLLDSSTVVILSSPLTRCVQTSHYIVEGLCGSSTPAAASDMTLSKSDKNSVPVIIEHSLCEGVYWMHQDIKRNRFLRGEKYPPHPIYYDSRHHKAHTSPLVRDDKPTAGLGPSPKYSKGPDDVLQEEPCVEERCTLGALGLLSSKEFSGKTVICVGHGETVALWGGAIGSSTPPCGVLTGFTEFMPRPAQMPQDKGKARNGSVWCVQGTPFMAPHLQQAMTPGGK